MDPKNKYRPNKALIILAVFIYIAGPVLAFVIPPFLHPLTCYEDAIGDFIRTTCNDLGPGLIINALALTIGTALLFISLRIPKK